jgi:hypothetical protein
MLQKECVSKPLLILLKKLQGDKEDEGIRYLGEKDIAAMKLRAIENSGNRAKDFIDVYSQWGLIPYRKADSPLGRLNC